MIDHSFHPDITNISRGMKEFKKPSDPDRCPCSGTGDAMWEGSGLLVALRPQPRTTPRLDERSGKELLSHLEAGVNDTKGKRDLVRFRGAKGGGAIARITCQDLDWRNTSWGADVPRFLPGNLCALLSHRRT